MQKVNDLIAFAQQDLLGYAGLVYENIIVSPHHEIIADHLEAIAKREINRLIINMPPRHGKQCANDTPVFTPKGWTTHGELKVGDFVYHPSGKPIAVLAIGQEAEQDYTVETYTGSKIECHENHEWTVYDRWSKCWKTVSTKYLAKQNLSISNRARFQLPEVNALETIEYKNDELHIDPYFFGAWLGDGKSSGSTICKNIKDLCNIENKIEYEQGSSWVDKNTGVVYRYFKGGALKALQNLGVINNKHIPECFFVSPKSKRASLLAGLVDTDGSLDPKTGRVRIRTASNRLANDISLLVKTLGYRASIDYTPADNRNRKIKGGENWCVQWTPHDGLGGGLIDRKKSFRKRKKRKIGIKAVYKSNVKLGKCIQVDSQDGLYLVGKDLIPTHNSMLVSQLFPPWYMHKFPEHKIIACSYSQELANDYGRFVRDMTMDEKTMYIFGRTKFVDMSSRSKKRFDNVCGGSYYAVGRGGPIVGRGGDIILIDDLIKNKTEALSKNLQGQLYDWYKAVIYTRLMPNGAIILINTRWTEDDLTGKILADSKDEWVKLSLPAIDKENKALWPEFFDIDRLYEIKREIGTLEFEAQYQQNPKTAKGNIVKRAWINEVDELPKGFEEIIQSWDLSFTGKETSDYVVGQVWGRNGSSFYLLDQIRGKYDFTDTIHAIKNTADRWPTARLILIEKAANAEAVNSQLKSKISGIVLWRPTGSKLARLNSVTPLFEAGNVNVLKTASFKDDWIDELCGFPFDKHDDQVDASTMALIRLHSKGTQKSFPTTNKSNNINSNRSLRF